ncbi:hypothetical protein Y1Q_0004088 [Alligator mississippiensis]|uniref:Uncharacterized protein n=1 Tax=Alligator mississippiensis TaxID=8496 RepID=A0A151PI51_ALLMI|nr:hypothetical protein Y1Q_0004088 [Alligator mississippiensis]
MLIQAEANMDSYALEASGTVLSSTMAETAQPYTRKTSEGDRTRQGCPSRKPSLKNGEPEQACPIMSLSCSESDLMQDRPRETMFQKHPRNTRQFEGL